MCIIYGNKGSLYKIAIILTIITIQLCNWFTLPKTGSSRLRQFVYQKNTFLGALNTFKSQQLSAISSTYIRHLSIFLTFLSKVMLLSLMKKRFQWHVNFSLICTNREEKNSLRINKKCNLSKNVNKMLFFCKLKSIVDICFPSYITVTPKYFLCSLFSG